MKITISENQKKVLLELAEHYGSDSDCLPFKYIALGTKLTIREVRLACRALARKGYTILERGLVSEDGMLFGSAYCCTRNGKDFSELLEVALSAKKKKK